MSLYQFKQAEAIQQDFDPSVDSLIMAAVLKADQINLMKLRHCWPGIVDEYYYRYNSGGGRMPGEAGYDPTFDENIRIQAEKILTEETP